MGASHDFAVQKPEASCEQGTFKVNVRFAYVGVD